MTPTTAGVPASGAAAQQPQAAATAEYCAKLQEWMWRCYWAAPSAWPCPPPQQGPDAPAWNSRPHPFSLPAASSRHTEPGAAADARRNQSQAGQEYNTPSPLQRVLAETVDFCVLFSVQATVLLWFVHLTGMKDIATFMAQFVVLEIDESTSMEDLQTVVAVALVYRVYVCVYETVCLWGTGGVTPGKLLLGLQVVTCDSTTVVRPNRVRVVPASNISFSASAVRALNKNFSVAFLIPVFITVLFFQHNRPVYDIMAGTIVVQRRGAR